MHIRFVCALLACAAFLHGLPVGAQELSVGSVPRIGSPDSLPRLGAPPVRGERPPLYLSTQTGESNVAVRVAVATPYTLASLTSADSLTAAVRQCAVPALEFAGATSRDSARAAALRLPQPWLAVDSATAHRSYILVSVDVPIGPTAACEVADDPSLALEGVQFVAPDARVFKASHLQSAVVEVAGRPVSPAFGLAGPSVRISILGATLPDTLTTFKFYFAPDQLGPDSRGRFSSAVVRFARHASTHQDSIVIPDTVIASAWRALTGPRLESLAALGTVHEVPRLPVTGAGVYSAAARMYAAGNPVAAAAAAAHLRDTHAAASATRDNRRFASLLIGSVFAAAGDTVAARVEYAAAVADRPCLRFRFHPDFDRVLDQVRPSARCTSLEVNSVLRAGLRSPGGAQRLLGARGAASTIRGVTAGLLVAALGFEAVARVRYRPYRSAPPDADITALYRHANVMRLYSQAASLSGIGLWAGADLYAYLSEWMHARRVNAQENFEPVAAAGDPR